MSSSIPDISAICIIRAQIPAPSTTSITSWIIEEDLSSTVASSPHPHFNPEIGVYTVPIDGIYLVKVEVIPIGGAVLRSAQKTRKRVDYALRVQDPQGNNHFFDIGSHNLGGMHHLQTGTMLGCTRMAGASTSDCLRLKISCIQRKRKRERESVSKKQRKRRRAARKATRFQRVQDNNDAEDSDESEWENGFDSDSTCDELPGPCRNVGTLARRLRNMASGDHCPSCFK